VEIYCEGRKPGRGGEGGHAALSEEKKNTIAPGEGASSGSRQDESHQRLLEKLAVLVSIFIEAVFKQTFKYTATGITKEKYQIP
jgi:hypothetical protein